MHIEFNCSCGTRMRTAADNSGKRAKCPKCGNLVAIPTTTPVRAKPPLASATQPEVKPRVVARPVAATPVARASASPANFDPLDFNSLEASHVSLPPAYDPLHGSMPTSTWNHAAHAAHSRQSHAKALLIATVGVVAVLVMIGLGIGIYKLASSKGSLLAGWSSGSWSSGSGTTADSGNKASGSSGSGNNSLFPAESPLFATRNVNPPITQAEADKIGREFSEAVQKMDRATCQRLFQFDLTLDEIAREAKMSTKDRTDFKRGFASRSNLWEQIHLALMKEGGEYECLRSLPREGGLRPILRLRTNESGLNYHELVLARDTSGSPIVVDIYNYTSGETHGDTLRSVVYSMIATRDATLMGRLTGRSRQLAEYGAALQKIGNLSTVNPRGALDEIDRLPPSVQQEKTIMLLRLRLANAIDQNLANSTFEKFRQLFPNDASVDLLSIDYYVTRNQNPLAIQAIEKLKLHIGGDPVLDEMIAALK